MITNYVNNTHKMPNNEINTEKMIALVNKHKTGKIQNQDRQRILKSKLQTYKIILLYIIYAFCIIIILYIVYFNSYF